MSLSARLAELHALAFVGAARWSEAAFAAALEDKKCFLATDGGTEGASPIGFALGRAVADEAELLTLVVHPDHRRTGLGRDLLFAFELNARKRGAAAAFLEVSADNAAARALYERSGWRMVGQRSGYYDGIDAIAMRKDL